MKQAKQRKHIWFGVGLLASIAGVAAIPGIVLFAGREIYVAMACCILLTADLLYGVPFYWIAYGNALVNERTVSAVEQGVETAQDLSGHQGCTVREATNRLTRCIQRGYLPGYILRDGRLYRIQKREEMGLWRYVCDYCGSIFENPIPDGKCPHCAAVLRREKIEKTK